MTSTAAFKSPLHQMTQTTATCLWNDSAAEAELAYAIDHGAVGATCNPVIAVEVVKKELRVLDRRGSRRSPPSTRPPRKGSWRGASSKRCRPAARRMLRPIFEAHRGRNGRLSIQTDPRMFRDGPAILRQAIHFDALAPNMIVKIPATVRGHLGDRGSDGARDQHQRDGLVQRAAGARGRRGGRARSATAEKRDGGDITTMGPVCTIMVGRLDDWLKVVADKQVITRRSRLSGVGRRRGVQARLRALPRTRLPPAAALGRVPQSHALERTDRRRRRDLAAARLAEALQLLRRRGRSRASTRPVDARIVERASPKVRRFPPRLRAGRAHAGRVRRLRSDRPDAAPVLRRVS